MKMHKHIVREGLYSATVLLIAFQPLLCSPKLMIFGAAAQFGIIIAVVSMLNKFGSK